MFMFQDRNEAGKELGHALQKYKGEGTMVLAIPRGGVEIGDQVSRALEAPLSLLVTRKLPFPDNPESGFGAIAEDGSTFIFDEADYWLKEDTIKNIINEQKKEVRRRIENLRMGKPLPEIRGSTVILVDDGIAMGSTMRASIKLVQNRQAKRIIVGAPVSSPERKDEMQDLADEVIILETPADFRAVAQVYRNWYDLSDEEVNYVLENSQWFK